MGRLLVSCCSKQTCATAENTPERLTACASHAQRGLLAGAAAAGAGAAFYLTADTDTQFALASATGPVLRMLDPETSHILGIQVG
jgi:hypothetical protein